MMKKDLLFLINISNPKPLNAFLQKNPEVYNKQNKTLNISTKSFISRYKKYVRHQLLAGSRTLQKRAMERRKKG